MAKTKKPEADSSKTESFTFEAIGFVKTPFKDRFGVPRQPGLANSSKGIIKIKNDPNLKTSLKSLEEFSHLWIIFVFHAHGAKDWKPSIRPPRLGGQKKVGVLASRSPHRPNPIGISAVAIEKIDLEAKGSPEITVSGVDLVDGTPVLDLKPYVPYADSIPEASAGWAAESIRRIPVEFSKDALAKIKNIDSGGDKDLRQIIVEILELDPRPAFQQRNFPQNEKHSWGKKYGIDIQGFDVKYEIQKNCLFVFDIL